MRYKKYILVAALLTLTALPMQAQAYDGYAATRLNVRAGPSGNYPVTARIDARKTVNILSCTNNWVWCDVETRNARGWVAGKYLQGRHNNRNASVNVIGALLGLPVSTFNERTYWGNHYYDRDFYRTRYGWNNDHSRYGWQRVNGRWAHDDRWERDHSDRSNRHWKRVSDHDRDRDRDRDGMSDRYDRTDSRQDDKDNDGIADRNDRYDDRYRYSGQERDTGRYGGNR